MRAVGSVGHAFSSLVVSGRVDRGLNRLAPKAIGVEVGSGRLRISPGCSPGAPSRRPARLWTHRPAIRAKMSVVDRMSCVDQAWPVLNRLVGGHVAVYRLTGGLLGHRFRGGPPMLLLDHRGARTGRARTTPLVYVADAANTVIVASKGGHPRHPAWFHNLVANPDTTIQVGRERRPVRARVATPAERERLWPKAVATYGGYRDYQRRAGREIPLVILEPRPA